MPYCKLTPWDGSRRVIHRCIAAAIGCHPYTVRRWDKNGGLPKAILAYLEEDSVTRYASRRERAKPATDPKP